MIRFFSAIRTQQHLDAEHMNHLVVGRNPFSHVELVVTGWRRNWPTVTRSQGSIGCAWCSPLFLFILSDPNPIRVHYPFYNHLSLLVLSAWVSSLAQTEREQTMGRRLSHSQVLPTWLVCNWQFPSISFFNAILSSWRNQLRLVWPQYRSSNLVARTKCLYFQALFGSLPM